MPERVVATTKTSESKQICPNSCKQNPGFNFSGSLADRILQLQRTAGNQAVQRLIKSGKLQAKLKIGQPNDIYEQEAERVAEQVMRMPEPVLQRQNKPDEEEEKPIQAKPVADQITPLVQRQPEVEEDEKEELLQTNKISGQNAEPTPDLESRINAFRSGGQPLAESERAFFEPRFGFDFGKVRVHTDSQASEAARAVKARAFTIGRDVVFGKGEYAPETGVGRQLMAHELTHVVQQEHTRIAPFYIQREAGVVRLEDIVVPVTPPERMITAEDVAGILSEHINAWWEASREGIRSASLTGLDDAARWFLVALGGNLVWASAAFLNPTATIAIRIMSAAGAVIGAGTLQRLFDDNQDQELDHFRRLAVRRLSDTHIRIVSELADPISELREIFFDQLLADRDDEDQAVQRRRVAWEFLFPGDIPPYDRGALESRARSDIEAIWADFLPCYRSLRTIITPRYILENHARYTLVCYYRALVSSGVAERTRGVRGEPVAGGTRYEFPGGATVTRTRQRRDFWFGGLTADVPQ